MGAEDAPRALVVHTSGARGSAIQGELERLGFAVEACAGPRQAACELRHGLPCPKLERAAGEGSIAFIGGLHLGMCFIEELFREYTRRFSRVIAVGPHPAEIPALEAMGVEVAGASRRSLRVKQAAGGGLR